ncbi:MAG: NAD(P)H-dependent oxidoreductase [Rhizobiaceae bacterium]|jgi:putative NADPH-quinone reductase
MPRRIVVILGHPDLSPKRLCRALADSYAEGARSAGHEVRRIDVARLDFPLLGSMQEFQHGMVSPDIKDAAEAIRRAEHIVFVFPLWLGTMPALLKGFLEQVMRPGLAFAYPKAGKDGSLTTLLKGHSARLIVTMGMPAPIYRFWYLGHGVAGIRRNILNFVGIGPVRESLFGMVESVSDARRRKWLAAMHALGKSAR